MNHDTESMTTDFKAYQGDFNNYVDKKNNDLELDKKIQS